MKNNFRIFNRKYRMERLKINPLPRQSNSAVNSASFLGATLGMFAAANNNINNKRMQSCSVYKTEKLSVNDNNSDTSTKNTNNNNSNIATISNNKNCERIANILLYLGWSYATSHTKNYKHNNNNSVFTQTFMYIHRLNI